MPTLDNFLLGNYGLGGPAGSKFTSKILSGISGTLTVPPNSTNLSMYFFATIPAGSDLVSFGTQGSTTPLTMYYNSNSSSTAIKLALIDANGVVFQLTPLAYSTTISIANVLVDTNAKAMMIYVNGTVSLNGSAYAWAPAAYNKPIGFDKNAGDMTLALVATSAASASTVTFNFQNAVAYSA